MTRPRPFFLRRGYAAYTAGAAGPDDDAMTNFEQIVGRSGPQPAHATGHDPVWAWSREEIEAHYTQGHCHVLAVALRRLTGLPLAALWNPFEWHVEPDENGQGGVPEIVHVYVTTADGDVIDIRGERTLEDLRRSEAGPDWEACPYGPLTDERLQELVYETGNLCPYDEADVEEALEVIRRSPGLSDAVARHAAGACPSGPRG